MKHTIFGESIIKIHFDFRHLNGRLPKSFEEFTKIAM